MKKIVNLLIVCPLLLVGCNKEKEISMKEALNIINNILIDSYDNFSATNDLKIDYSSPKLEYSMDFNYDKKVCYIKNSEKDLDYYYHINDDNYIELDLTTKKYNTMDINKFTINRWDNIINNIDEIKDELYDVSNELLEYFKIVVNENIEGYSFYSNNKDSLEVREKDNKYIVRFDDYLLSYLEVNDGDYEYKLNISFDSRLSLPSLIKYKENEYKAIFPNEDNEFIDSIIEKSYERYNYKRDYTIIRKHETYLNDELKENYVTTYKYDFDKNIAEFTSKDDVVFTFVAHNDSLAYVFSSSGYYTEYNGSLASEVAFNSYLNPYVDKENCNRLFVQYKNYSLNFNDAIDNMTRFYKKSNEDFYFETRYFLYMNYENKSYHDSNKIYKYEDSLIKSIEENDIYNYVDTNELYDISVINEFNYDGVELDTIEVSNKYTKLNVSDFNKLIKI